LHRGQYDFLAFAGLCFAPFLALALFANFLYYLKAQRMIRRAKSLFANHLDRLAWLENRAGTSSSAAFFFLLAFGAALLQLVPQHWQVSQAFALSPEIVKNEAELKKIRLRTGEAEKFFDIAESHYNADPPDYLKAEMAYDIAADNGSLLAAYKLGYLHYTGEGSTRRDHGLAFDYFTRATRAPLAFQPHSLELTTRFLAESYRNLGIMYQAGLGTRKNLKHARAMYEKAVEFGSADANRQLDKVHDSSPAEVAADPAVPDYR
jgi:TPR repeat protein